jgi:hypothetical protein
MKEKSAVLPLMQSTTTQKSIAARQPLDFPSPQQGGRDM